MPDPSARRRPPFCPNPGCDFHLASTGWKFKKMGFFLRQTPPRRIQRYRCQRCGRSFSSQTFSPTYWLRRPALLAPLFHRVLACSGFRQIAREFEVSPTTVLRQVERLGRHCLLFHEQHRPRGPLGEAVVLDGFRSFEFGQYWPFELNLLVGQGSHYLYAFSDAELRRSGRMTSRQRRRRAAFERRYGRPSPRARERAVRELLALVVPAGSALELHSDDDPAYPRAIRALRDRAIEHRVTASTLPRTPRNPLFPVNLFDLLIRHSSANHKRETIAFSKRRQSALYRLAILGVWRNYVKSFSERRRDETPAQRMGLMERRLRVQDVLEQRLFPSRLELREPIRRCYWGRTPSRRIGRVREHRLRYAA
jgi:transposase-like protein